MWEWYFRTTLDHWSTFLGMIFAANYPITALWLKKVEALPPMKEWTIKLSVLFALLSVFVWWVRNPFSEPKVRELLRLKAPLSTSLTIPSLLPTPSPPPQLSYNLTNCYFGFIPLITYIYARNIHPTLRSRSMNLLHTIGKTTLETYLLQHHLWLTSNAKSLLILIPGWPKCNFLVVTIVYFFTSRRVYSLTMYLRGMLLPNNLQFCLRSLAAIAGILIFSLLLSTVFNTPGAVCSGEDWSRIEECVHLLHEQFLTMSRFACRSCPYYRVPPSRRRNQYAEVRLHTEDNDGHEPPSYDFRCLDGNRGCELLRSLQ